MRPPFIADNGEELTSGEARAIRSLRELARTWPESLTLLVMDTRIYVTRTGDSRPAAGSKAEQEAAILAAIDRIPCDGGGW